MTHEGNMNTLSATIGIIGCGNMGQAMAGLLVRYTPVFVYDTDRSKTAGLKKRVKKVRSCSLEQLLAESAIVILAVKPQNMADLLSKISKLQGAFEKKQVFVSIAAGISIRFLEQRLPKGAAIVRTMPNLGLKIGMSFTAVCFNKKVKTSGKESIKRVFSSLGAVMVVKEEMIDKITAVSGSGPGYIFYFLKAIADAAVRLGLGRELAEKMVRATASGAVGLLQTEKASLQEWQDRICSKGGTTRAALNYLDEHTFGKLIAEAVKKAYRRARELSS